MLHSTSLKTALAGVSDKVAHGNALSAAIGSSGIRFRCKRDANAAAADPWATGTEFINMAMAGPLSVNQTNGTVTLGALSGTILRAAADLSTGASVFRIESGTNYIQGTLGLIGSGKELIVSGSPTANSGFVIAGAALVAPTVLPLSGGAAIGSTLATMSIANTTGSSTASDFIPPMFGHPFKKGDVPAGAFPRFEVAGTVCPYTMFNKTTWSDGSLKFASFLLRVPASVTGNSAVSVAVKATNTAPATTSSRTLADLSSAGTDLNVTVVGLENITGTWVSSLNQGVADADDIILYGDGPVGKVWRVRQQFMQSGANHGQLECYWYVAVLQNAAGGLHGIRYLGRVTQPWFDVGAPTKAHRAFTSFLVKNGASTVRNGWANHATPQSFGYPVSGQPGVFSVPSMQFEGQTLVRVSGTTLPTGLTAGTSYILDKVNDPNQIKMHPIGGEIFTGTDITGTASGDCVMTGYPYLTHFGSLWTCGATAKWDYVQAGGTVAADATVRVLHDSTYEQTTGIVPRYDPVTPAVQAGYNYELMTMGPIQRSVHTTGERPDIGLMPSWYVAHLLSQRAVDEQVVRVCGLAMGHVAIALYSNATKTIKPLNAGTYAGMPASSSNFRWAGNSTYTQGFTGPTGVLITGFDSMTFDHMPALPQYPYIVTGEPQFLDLIIEIANHAVEVGYPGFSTATSNLCSAERNIVINGTTYTGVVSLDGEARTSAWSIRDIGSAATLLPDTPPQCAAYKQYFKDLNAANFAAMRNYTDNVAPTAWRTYGQMQFNDSAINSPWMLGYELQAMAQAARSTENPDALYMVNHGCKWFTSVYNAHGAWHVTSYRSIVRTAAGSAGPLMTSMSSVAYYATSPGVSWTTGTNLFSVATQDDGFTFVNGDVLMWDGVEFADKPGGLAYCTPYYIINKSGNSFQLSLSVGGAAVAVTDTWQSAAFFRLGTPPSTNVIGHGLSAAGYLSNIRGALKLSQLAGATVSTALVDDLTTRAGAIDYTSDCKYNFASHY